MNKFYCGEEEHRTEIRTRFTLQNLAFQYAKPSANRVHEHTPKKNLTESFSGSEMNILQTSAERAFFIVN